MLSGRGKMLMFADADGATKFADLSKLELEMKKINTQEVIIKNFVEVICYFCLVVLNEISLCTREKVF